MVSRNSLCTCGSGKKYKKCCGATHDNNTTQLNTISFLLNRGAYTEALNAISKSALTKCHASQLKLLIYYLTDDFDEAKKLQEDNADCQVKEEIALQVGKALTIKKEFKYLLEWYQYVQGSSVFELTKLYLQALVYLGEYELASLEINRHFLKIKEEKSEVGFAQLALKTQDFELSYKLLSLVNLANYKNPSQVEYLSALNLLKLKKYEEAKERLDMVLEREPKNIDALCAKAEVDIELNNKTQAKKTILKLLTEESLSQDIGRWLWGLCERLKDEELLEKFILSEVELATAPIWRLQLSLKTLHELYLLDEKKIQQEVIINSRDRNTFLTGYTMSMLYREDFNDEEILSEQITDSPKRNVNCIAVTDSSVSKIRIGFISSDFHNHSVAYFFLPFVCAISKEEFEIFCYYSGTKFDNYTKEIKEQSYKWEVISHLSDEKAAEHIKSDKLNLLIDLNGLTKGNRLGVFALRPTRLQATWIGYPATTGMAEMDFFFTDRVIASDPTISKWHVEKIRAMGDVFSTYAPHQNMLGISSVKKHKNSAVTLGSFNNLAKINSFTLSLWAEILKQVGNARLVIKAKPLAYKSVQKAINSYFSERGIETKRITLISHDKNQQDHWQRYSEVDIALDSYPYNGTTTTCEALYLGVPVLSLAGSTHRSRVGLSFLTAVGLKECVAFSAKQFVNMAVNFASNREKISILRSKLKNQSKTSPLFNSENFIKEFEEELKKIVGKHGE